MKVFFSLFLIVFSLSSSAQIFENNDIVEIINHAESGSLIVFDLDNTVMTIRKNNGFGGDTWFEKEIGRLLQVRQIPLERIPHYIDYFIAADWELMQESLVNEVELVDPRITDAIKVAKERNVTMIGQTARTYKMTDVTHRQLKFLGIQFDNVLNHSPLFGAHQLEETINIDIPHDLSEEHMYGMLFHPVYKNGVIFTGPHSKRTHNNKGLVLSHFFHQQLGVTLNNFSKIIFIDDKMKNVKAIYESIEELNPGKVMAFRYGATDNATIDLELAKKQYLYFRLHQQIAPVELLKNHTFCEANFSKNIPAELDYLLDDIID